MASEIKVVKFLNGVKVELDHSGAPIDILLKKLKTKESQSDISGADAVLPSPDSSFVLLNNNALESILTINPSTLNELLIIHNGTANPVTIKGTGNIILGTDEDLVMESGSSLLLYQVESLNKYAVIGGTGGGGGGKKVLGTNAVPIVFPASTTIPFDGYQNILIYVCKGAVGGVDLSAVNPQIANGKKIGQELWLLCIDGADTFQLANGNNLIMKGPYLSDLYSVVKYLWLGTGWLNITRQY